MAAALLPSASAAPGPWNAPGCCLGALPCCLPCHEALGDQGCVCSVVVLGQEWRSEVSMAFQDCTGGWKAGTGLQRCVCVWGGLQRGQERLKGWASLAARAVGQSGVAMATLGAPGWMDVMQAGSIRGLGLRADSSIRLCHWRGSPVNFCSC